MATDLSFMRSGRPAASSAVLADRHMQEWEKRRMAVSREGDVLVPTICLSRKIGSGAREVADRLAEKIGYRVVDKEILEYATDRSTLSEKAVAFFNEQHPGLIGEYLSMMAGRKAFVRSENTRHLLGAIYALAHLAPTIFLGRGSHRALPRDRVLAVRIICGDVSRVARLAVELGMDEKEAELQLEKIDRQQGEFLQVVYGQKGFAVEEFDLVLNRDFIVSPDAAAGIIAMAFREKFGGEAVGRETP